MYELSKTLTQDVSPKRAAEILSRENNFEGQRQMRQPWAQFLAEAISQGRLAKGNLAFAENGDGKRVVMNGQHTLQGIVLSDKTLRCTVDEYHCEMPDDFWKLFATFDVGKSRSEGDVMRAAKGLFSSERLRTVSTRVLTCCGSALNYLGDGVVPNFHAAQTSKIVKPELVQKYEREVVFVRDLYEGLPVPTVPIVAPIIASWRVNQERSLDFWSRILNGAELVKGTPEWNLFRSLGKEATLSVRANLSKTSSGSGRIIGTWNLCISWWNAYITNNKRTGLKLAAIKGIVKIEGGK